SNLVLSGITLVPTFDPATLNYSATVPSSVSMTAVSPTAQDAGATITVNGTPVASGDSTSDLLLFPGPNTITTEVTAADGVTTRTYVAEVTRNSAPTAIDLDSTLVSENQPAGTPVGTFSTTDTDAGDTHLYALVAGAGDTGNASFQIVGDQLQTAAILDADATPTLSIRVETDDQNGDTFEQSFTITVDNLPLAVDDGGAGFITPAGDPLLTSDTLLNDDLGNEPTLITAFDNPSSQGGTVQIPAPPGRGGGASSGNFEYTPPAGFFGDDTFTYTITDVDGDTSTATVTITVTNEVPTAIGLSNNQVVEGQASGAVVGSLTTTDADPGDSHVYSLVAGAGDTDNAQFQIAGDQLQTAAVLDAAATPTLSVRIETDDQNGGTFEQAFTITVISTNTNLSALTLTDITLVPAFDPGVLFYNAIEPITTGTTQVTATLEDPAASFTVNGTPETSGVASNPVSLGTTSTAIDIVVAAEDGVTTQTYTVVITPSFLVGETGPGGGLVFYLEPSTIAGGTGRGTVGLEAAASDHVTQEPWGCEGTTVPGADATAIGTGQQNTTDTLAGCGVRPIAASVADDFTGGGFDDWFLPSEEELNLMYTNLHDQPAPLGGFSNVFYWSSSELSSTTASFQFFNDGSQGANFKDLALRVRVARAFGPTFDLGEAGPGSGLVYFLDPASVDPVTGRGSVGQEASPADLIDPGDSDELIAWGCDGTATGASGQAVGDGEVNTDLIVANPCSSTGNEAAEVAAALISGGVNDWFLPSLGELQLMDLNLDNQSPSLGNFASGDFYWSSSEATIGSARIRSFGGSVGSTNKFAPLRVRAAREFAVRIAVVNSAPTAINLDNDTVIEGDTGGTTVGTLTTDDADAGNTHVYTLVAGAGDADNGSFEIVDDQLRTTNVTKAGAPDYNIRIQTDDQNGGTFQQAFVLPVVSANAFLSDLTLTDVTLVPVFGSGTFSYTANVPSSVSSTQVTPESDAVAEGGVATITVNGTTVASGATSAPIALAVGSNIITTVVTAEDGATMQTYTVDITRNAAPTNLALSNNEVEENQASGTPVGTFITTDADGGDTHIYTLVAGAGDTDNASFQIVGDELQTAATLNADATPTLSVRVETDDQNGGTFEQSFTILVDNLPLAGDDSGLPDFFVLKNDAIQPTVTGNDDLGNEPTKITSFDNPSSQGGEVILGGARDDIGTNNFFTYEPPIDFVGNDTFTYTLTDADGDTSTATVTIIVGSSELSALALSGVTLSPAFDPNTLTYTASVPTSTTSTTVTPTAEAAGSTITVNGSSVASGATSAPVTLAEGPNTITVVVTAQDGTTTRTYTIDITRNSAPTAIALDSTEVEEGQASGTPVGTLTTTDADPGTPHLYTLVAGTGDTDNGSFQIVGDELQTAAILDAVATPTLSIRVLTDDQSGGTFEQSFIIVVDNLPEAVDDGGALFTTDANTAFQTAPIGTNDDLGNEPTTVTNFDNPSVAGGAVELLDPALRNAADNFFGYTPPTDFFGEDTFTYTITDNDGDSSTATVTITVNDTIATLSDLTLTDITLVPAFDPAVTSYTADVDFVTAITQATPTSTTNTATIMVNGTTVDSGTNGGLIIDLNEGSNVI
ncbi:MAG: cadherin-like beta sandwich domain-containing protein, partial [Gammaproteobacteria bacterium]|nr:cadherin-like beta sandwich domain-containing protein [Gammaproteobacteria bacterium]